MRRETRRLPSPPSTRRTPPDTSTPVNATTALIGNVLLLVGAIAWCAVDPGWAPVLAEAALLVGLFGLVLRVSDTYRDRLAGLQSRRTSQDHWHEISLRCDVGSVLTAWAPHITTWEELWAARQACRRWRVSTAQVLRHVVRDEAAAAAFEGSVEAAWPPQGEWPPQGDLPREIEAHVHHVQRLSATLGEVGHALMIVQ